MSRSVFSWNNQTLLIEGQAWNTPAGLNELLNLRADPELRRDISRELLRAGFGMPLAHLRQHLHFPVGKQKAQFVSATQHLETEHLNSPETFLDWCEQHPREAETLLNYAAFTPQGRTNLSASVLLLGMVSRDPQQIGNAQVLAQLCTPNPEVLWSLWTQRPDLLRGSPADLRGWLNRHPTCAGTVYMRGLIQRSQWREADLAAYAHTLAGTHVSLTSENLWRQAEIAVTYERPELSARERVPHIQDWGFLLSHTKLLDHQDPVTDTSLGFLLMVLSRRAGTRLDPRAAARHVIAGLTEPGSLNTWFRQHLPDEEREIYATELLRGVQSARLGHGRWAYAQPMPHIYDEESDPTYVHIVHEDGGDEHGPHINSDDALMLGSHTYTEGPTHLASHHSQRPDIYAQTVTQIKLWNGTDWVSDVLMRDLALTVYPSSLSENCTPDTEDMNHIREALRRGRHQQRLAAQAMSRLSALLNIEPDPDLHRWAESLARPRPTAQCSRTIQSMAMDADQLPF